MLLRENNLLQEMKSKQTKLKKKKKQCCWALWSASDLRVKYSMLIIPLVSKRKIKEV